MKRFLDTNKKWYAGRSKCNKDEYYNFFSTVNWVSLDDETKRSHTIDCKECKKFAIQTTYPTAAIETEKTHKKIINIKILIKVYSISFIVYP